MLTQNEDAFRALDFGADDFDLPIEDEVTQKAGATSTSTSRGCSPSPARSATRSSTGAPSGRRRSAGMSDADVFSDDVQDAD